MYFYFPCISIFLVFLFSIARDIESYTASAAAGVLELSDGSVRAAHDLRAHRAPVHRGRLPASGDASADSSHETRSAHPDPVPHPSKHAAPSQKDSCIFSIT